MSPIFRTLSVLKNWNSISTKWQFPIPISPSPWQPLTSLLSIRIWLVKLNHIIEIIQYSSFSDWVISLYHVLNEHSSCTMSQNFLPFKGWIIFYNMYTQQVYTLLNWWTKGCFYFLTVVKYAAVNKSRQDWVPAFNYFGNMSRMGLLDYVEMMFSVLWEIAVLFSIAVAPLYSPTSSIKWDKFLDILSNTYCLLFLW